MRTWARSWRRSRSRRGCWCRCRYWSALGAIAPACIANPAIGTSAPDDHFTSRFTSRPHCGVSVSSRWRVFGVGCGPGVRARIVLASRVYLLKNSVAAPDDHLCSGPNCCVTLTTVGWCDVTGSDPSVGDRIVSPASIGNPAIRITAPDDHFARRPHSGMKISRRRRVDGARGCPTIRGGIVSPTGAQLVESKLSLHKEGDRSKCAN